MKRTRYKATPEDMLIFHPPEIPEPCTECPAKRDCWDFRPPNPRCGVPTNIHCIDCRKCCQKNTDADCPRLTGEEKRDRAILIEQAIENALRRGTLDRWSVSDNKNPHFREWKEEHLAELKARGIRWQA